MGVIYKVTNLINGKCYVGKTTQDFKKYKNSHITNALNENDIKRGYEKIFYDAIRKYGCNNFKWEILKDGINDDLILNVMETFMITIHHSHRSEGGYNLTWGGDGCSGYRFTIEQRKRKSELAKGKNIWSKGSHRNEETKQKMSISAKGKNTWSKGSHHSDETKIKISNGNKGKKYSFESRMKISNALKGKKTWMCGKHHTDESKQKNRNSQLGKTLSEETKQKIRESLIGRIRGPYKKKEI